MAPVPAPASWEVRPRYFFWIWLAALALGPMCTTSTSPRYIQCTGKPNSGCGPLFMPSTLAYQSRVASMSSAATRRCSICERGIALIYNDVRFERQAADVGGGAQGPGHRARPRAGGEDRRHDRRGRRGRAPSPPPAHGGGQVPY